MRIRWPATAVLVLLALCALPHPANAQHMAPEFAGITRWIHSRPLQMRRLRGKVVLIDFWAYSCINCLRSMPHVVRWYETYKDKGLVVIGVHTPEFTFEKSIANVRAAAERLGIRFPIAMDNDSATWNAWNNRYWPTEYLIDRNGNVVLRHEGEGRYLETENAIRKLLGLPPSAASTSPRTDVPRVGSPEMYLGTGRVRFLSNPASRPEEEHVYRAPPVQVLNTYALHGRWRMQRECAELVDEHGGVRVRFLAGKANIVASSERPATLQITVDGKPQMPVVVQASKLYRLYAGGDYREHLIDIRIRGRGLRVYTLAFG